MSVEDIERNIRNQQLQQKTDPKPSPPLQNLRQQNARPQQLFPQSMIQTPKVPPLFMQSPQQQQQQQQQNSVNDRMPPHDMNRFNARFNTFNAPSPQMNIMPPHPNAQQSPIHPNLARIPPNAHMPMNNLNVSCTIPT